MTKNHKKKQLIKNQTTCCHSEYKPGKVLFRDKRSKRVVFVTHCILNQNAMIDGLPSYPGVVLEVVDMILASDCSIVQFECPELIYLGLDRKVDISSKRTVESEDSRIRVLMLKRPGRRCCQTLAKSAFYQIEQYIRNRFTVVGVLGINASPTCGVETTWSEGKEIIGPGVFIRELQKICARHKIEIQMRGINLKDPAEAIEVIRQLLDGIT